MRSIALVGILCLAACEGTRPPLPFFDGQEDPDLRARAHGTLVSEDVDDIPLAAIDVRTGAQWQVRSDRGMGTVKVADLATGHVATLLPCFDLRHHVSWGPFERDTARRGTR